VNTLKKIKAVVAHPLQQHSFYTAIGIIQNEDLQQYLTSFYYDENKIFYRIMKIVLNKYSKRIVNRKNCVIDSKVTTFCTVEYLVLNLVFKLDSHNVFYPYLYRRFCNRFGKKVAEYCIKNRPDVVIMYDTTAYNCFSILKEKAPNIIRIIDMSSSTTPFIQKIINEEKIKYPESSIGFVDKCRWYNSKLAKISIDEGKLADAFICGSDFSKRSVISMNPSCKTYVVPYGSNFSFKFRQKKYSGSILNFLYVGRLEYAKGINFLLEAFEACSELNISLTLVGRNLLPKGTLSRFKNVKYLGLVRKDEMPSIYKKADIYIMPSLFEGLSLTILEAMSASLPVIATYNSGASSLITDGNEGFIIRAMSKDDIIKCIRWFDQHREVINSMGESAHLKSLNYTWDAYYKNLDSVLKEIMMEK
jgi:glycosyltransferase involved in cell wall biosynthesis